MSIKYLIDDIVQEFMCTHGEIIDCGPSEKMAGWYFRASISDWPSDYVTDAFLSYREIAELSPIEAARLIYKRWIEEYSNKDGIEVEAKCIGSNI